MSNKPVNLIVANTMHEAFALVHDMNTKAKELARVARKYKADFDMQPLPENFIADQIARKLLCEISHEAKISEVYKALAAISAPSSAADIQEGLQAIEDKQPV